MHPNMQPGLHSLVWRRSPPLSPPGRRVLPGTLRSCGPKRLLLLSPAGPGAAPALGGSAPPSGRRRPPAPGTEGRLKAQSPPSHRGSSGTGRWRRLGASCFHLEPQQETPGASGFLGRHSSDPGLCYSRWSRQTIKVIFHIKSVGKRTVLKTQ